MARTVDVPNLWEVNLCLVADDLTFGRSLRVWEQSPSVHANRRRNCSRCYNSLCLRLCCGGCGEELTRGTWNVDKRGSLCRECYQVPETRSFRQCASIVFGIPPQQIRVSSFRDPHKFVLSLEVWAGKEAIRRL